MAVSENYHDTSDEEHPFTVIHTDKEDELDTFEDLVGISAETVSQFYATVRADPDMLRGIGVILEPLCRPVQIDEEDSED
jgi:hypothetical protein